MRFMLVGLSDYCSIDFPLILRGFTHKEGKMLAGAEDVRENSMKFEL